MVYSDEAGTGEQAENTLEWDWAGGSTTCGDPSDDPQYSDDDFEVEEARPTNDVKKQARRGDASVIAPAINTKGGGIVEKKAPKKPSGGTILPAL